jgi:membrane dipeptidase
MPILIDAHQDIAYNALTFKRDICASAFEIRRQEAGTMIPTWNEGEATVGWPEFQAGKVAVIFTTIWSPPLNYVDGAWDTLNFSNNQQASKLARQQFEYYHRLVEEHPDKFSLILTRADLERVLARWQAPENDPSPRPVGLMIHMEGAEGLRSMDELQEFYELGLRQVGPVWAGMRYCGGSKETRPFDNEGYALLDTIARLGMAMDISHMSESAALTALERFEGPVLASHSNARTPLKGRGGERHMTDQTIKLLFERDGCVGVVPYNKFLSPTWELSSPVGTVTINQMIEQIDYYCQIAGNSTHVGIGSDLDGAFGYPNIPLEFDTIQDFQKMAPALQDRGYNSNDIENIFWLNWKRHLEKTLPK